MADVQKKDSVRVSAERLYDIFQEIAGERERFLEECGMTSALISRDDIEVAKAFVLKLRRERGSTLEFPDC